MKIFLPFKNEDNPYLNEIEKFSKAEFIYGGLEDFKPAYKIINIHWPEALFDWKEPSYKQLEQLKDYIRSWKKHGILVYTKHDFSRNKGTTEAFSELFRIIETASDVFIHLGNYSKEFYQKKHPSKIHKVIAHPLFNHSYPKFPKDLARKKLNIKEGDFVICVPGNIRNFKERELVLRSFNAYNAKNKVLIATNMYSEIKYDFPGRIRLKKIFNIRDFVVGQFKSRHSEPKYYFSYGKMCAEELALRVAAADIIMVPRIKSLNSGILYLGLTFNKIVIGPVSGNNTEILNLFNLPAFQPDLISSVRNAVNEGKGLLEKGFTINTEDLQNFKSEKIAAEIDELFKNLVSNA